jgi:hypothetical protein
MNDPKTDIHKGMVLGYLLRSPQPEFSINVSKLSEVLTLTTAEINEALMLLATEERIKLTISRAVVRLEETESGQDKN